MKDQPDLYTHHFKPPNVKTGPDPTDFLAIWTCVRCGDVYETESINGTRYYPSETRQCPDYGEHKKRGGFLPLLSGTN